MRSGFRASPAYKFVSTSEQIALVIWFADVFIGAGRESADPGANVRLEREQDYRNFAGLNGRLQLGQECYAVAVGQLDIEHDQIEKAFAQGGAPGRQRGSRGAFVTAGFESCFQIHPDG